MSLIASLKYLYLVKTAFSITMAQIARLMSSLIDILSSQHRIHMGKNTKQPEVQNNILAQRETDRTTGKAEIGGSPTASQKSNS